MNLKDVVSKLIDGKEISESEKDFLKNYEEGIPKRRFNEEIAK